MPKSTSKTNPQQTSRMAPATTARGVPVFTNLLQPSFDQQQALVDNATKEGGCIEVNPDTDAELRDSLSTDSRFTGGPHPIHLINDLPDIVVYRVKVNVGGWMAVDPPIGQTQQAGQPVRSEYLCRVNWDQPSIIDIAYRQNGGPLRVATLKPMIIPEREHGLTRIKIAKPQIAPAYAVATVP